MSTPVTLDVLRGRRAVARARSRARKGRNRLTVRMPAKPGRYTLRLRASVDNQASTDTARLLVKR
jgi:hypothetical protein